MPQKRIPAERHVREPCQVRLERHDGGIDRAVLDLLDEPSRPLFAPGDRQLRDVARQRRGDVRQQIRTDGRDDAQAQRAAERIGVLPRELAKIAGGHQDLARLRAGALEQLHPERARQPPPGALSEGATWHASAARRKLPRSATATIYCSWRSETGGGASLSIVSGYRS